MVSMLLIIEVLIVMWLLVFVLVVIVSGSMLKMKVKLVMRIGWMCSCVVLSVVSIMCIFCFLVCLVNLMMRMVFLVVRFIVVSSLICR